LSRAGRKGNGFEADMENYRKYFSRGTKRTQNKNAIKLKQYCEWAKTAPEQLIQEYITARKTVNSLKDWERDTRTKIIEFYNYLKTKGYKINTARTLPLGILAFYSENCETIKEVTKEFDAVQIPTDEYIFTQEVLRKIYYYADLEGQTLLSLAVALGYSSIDFLNLEAEKLQNLVNEANDKGLEFIQFVGKSRAKTSVQPRSHLTPEAIHSLKDYLEFITNKHNGKLPKYVWCNGRPDTHITNTGLNKKLKRLVTKANIETYGKHVKFHCIRKFLYSRLQAKNRDIAKVITAKKVSASDLTYIPDLNAECLRVFKETYKEIALNGDLTGKTKQKQEQRIKELENQLQATRTVLLGLFGLNRKQVEAMVMNQLKKDGIASHKGMTVEQFVKGLTLEELMQQFEIILKQQET
jgi:integrase